MCFFFKISYLYLIGFAQIWRKLVFLWPSWRWTLWILRQIHNHLRLDGNRRVRKRRRQQFMKKWRELINSLQPALMLLIVCVFSIRSSNLCPLRYPNYLPAKVVVLKEMLIWQKNLKIFFCFSILLEDCITRWGIGVTFCWVAAVIDFPVLW